MKSVLILLNEVFIYFVIYIYMYVYNSSKYGCTIHPRKIKISRLTQEIVLDLTIDKRHLPFPRIVTTNLPVK